MPAYPMIPTLAPQTDEESPREYGLRAFRFLVSENLCAVLLDTRTLELAMAASQTVVTAPDTALAARERFHKVRLDVLTTIEHRKREEQTAAKAAAVSEPSPKPKSGGRPAPLRRPVPVLPPSGAAARPF